VALSVYSKSTEPPVDLGLAKLYVKATTPADDPLITSIVWAAEEHVSDLLNQFITSRTLDETFDRFGNNPRPPLGSMFTSGYAPYGFGGSNYSASVRISGREPISLGRAPLASVTSVKYLDENEVLQTWDSANYVVDTGSRPGRIFPAYGKVWPNTLVRENAVTIRYVCGYATAAAVPEKIAQCILQYITMLYDLRGPMLATSALQLNFLGFDAMIAAERDW
jgi:hypothetical protein